MAAGSRTVEDVRKLLTSCQAADSQQRMKFYDSWAETYEEDTLRIQYRATHLAVDLLSANVSGNREAVQVLDVACGSGRVAQLMAERGFQHFVGVDGSGGMLDQAAKTGLYQELKLALLGTEPLPAQPGAFDVVVLVGALDPGFVPVSVVRELCHAAKAVCSLQSVMEALPPGGLVCMSRGDHPGPAAQAYKQQLERELQRLQEEGLWSPAGLRHTDRYMEDPHLDPHRVQELQQDQRFLSGTAYLFQKASIQTCDQRTGSC